MSKSGSHPGRADSKFEVVHPLRVGSDGRPQPFPTIYWLTDPALDKALADLERRGVVRRIESAIRSDAELLRTLHGDHARYRDQRWAMLSPAERTTVEASASALRTFRGGVAGMADFDTIKCLHAHAAHHLADPDGNTVARLLIAHHDIDLG